MHLQVVSSSEIHHAGPHFSGGELRAHQRITAKLEARSLVFPAWESVSACLVLSVHPRVDKLQAICHLTEFSYHKRKDSGVPGGQGIGVGTMLERRKITNP